MNPWVFSEEKQLVTFIVGSSTKTFHIKWFVCYLLHFSFSLMICRQVSFRKPGLQVLIGIFFYRAVESFIQLFCSVLK